MKRILMTTVMLSLLGGPALAQQTSSGDPRTWRTEAGERLAERGDNRRDRRQDRREERQDNREDRRDDRQDRRADRRDDRQDNRQDRREDRRENHQDRQDDRGDRRDDRRDDRREHRADRRTESQRVVVVPRVRVETNRRDDWVRNYRPGHGHKLRTRDRDRAHYDYRRYQRTYQAPRRYRVPVYIAPSRWFSRSWAFGDILPYSSWYGTNYYLDAFRYGLPRPPIGTEWIRMRDDALLVDIWSGRVLAVYHNLFW